MLLKDMYTTDVVCCLPATQAMAAAGLMRQHHVGDLVVVDSLEEGRIPLGVVTDRDLVIEVLAKGLDPCTTTVGSLLSKPVVIANESEDTSQTIERMRIHGIRRVPVVNHHGAVVGIVTLNDLLNIVLGEAHGLLEIMAKAQKQEQHARR
ncbi:MAG TPA: CBS domain-containing protein [Steroidobacteraceae bacterium]|nr:CBS domain-containing protein [Steroidobacteraceae bacterium]